MYSEAAPDEGWYVGIDGVTYGPATVETLRSWVDAGSFRSGDYVWHHASASWVAAASLPEITHLFGEDVEWAGDAPLPQSAPQKREAALPAGDPVARLEAIAQKSGVPCGRSGKTIIVSVALAGGRRQSVYIEVIGKGSFSLGEVKNREYNWVSFYSPCFKNKPGFFGGLSRDQLIGMLRDNFLILHGTLAFLNLGDEEFLCAQDIALLETLDPEEFRAYVGYSAMIADDYEARFSKQDLM